MIDKVRHARLVDPTTGRVIHAAQWLEGSLLWGVKGEGDDSEAALCDLIRAVYGRGVEIGRSYRDGETP